MHSKDEIIIQLVASCNRVAYDKEEEKEKKRTVCIAKITFSYKLSILILITNTQMMTQN